jgi:UDP-N-acetylmuramoyl-tripeptide--D-alanyl-D-alanine ligase
MSDPLWTKRELLSVLPGEQVGAMPEAVTGISIDTRTTQPGELFVAIKGERTDGHHYIEQAFAAGAVLAVVGRTFRGDASGPFIRVPDTLEALNSLGQAGRARSPARIVAVTGSVGKTGTKEMLRLMLSRLRATHASDKSYNNHWGVPLSLARLPRDAAYAVFEIGMNHAGEITPLTRMVRPHAAIITTVGAVHIEFFDSVEGIAEAKAEIFRGLEPGGAAIVNMDNAFYPLLAARARENQAGRIIGFGKARGAEARLLALHPEQAGSAVEADILGQRVAFEIGAPGEHLAMNSLAALAAVTMLGGDAVMASAALAAFGAPAGRGAQSLLAIAGGTLLLLDESYNANPASMMAALAVLGELPPDKARRRIAVVGDMLELGTGAPAMHRELAGPVAAARVDKLYACGPNMRALYEVLPEPVRGAWAENSEALLDAVVAALRPGDAIMVKGSLGSRMGTVVQTLKQQFPPSADTTTAAA